MNELITFLTTLSWVWLGYFTLSALVVVLTSNGRFEFHRSAIFLTLISIAFLIAF